MTKIDESQCHKPGASDPAMGPNHRKSPGCCTPTSSSGTSVPKMAEGEGGGGGACRQIFLGGNEGDSSDRRIHHV